MGGGGFAESIGATHEIPAVGFSAPGQFLLMETLGLERELVKENVFTIMPDVDIVSRLAGHYDTVQRIECRDAEGKPRSLVDCHQMPNTICELWRVCGDIHKRNFSACLNTTKQGKLVNLVNESCIGKDFNRTRSGPC